MKEKRERECVFKHPATSKKPEKTEKSGHVYFQNSTSLSRSGVQVLSWCLQTKLEVLFSLTILLGGDRKNRVYEDRKGHKSVVSRPY